MIPLYMSLPKKGLLQLKRQFNFFMIAKYLHSPHNVAVNRGLGDRKKRYMLSIFNCNNYKPFFCLPERYDAPWVALNNYFMQIESMCEI